MYNSGKFLIFVAEKKIKDMLVWFVLVIVSLAVFALLFYLAFMVVGTLCYGIYDTVKRFREKRTVKG